MNKPIRNLIACDSVYELQLLLDDDARRGTSSEITVASDNLQVRQAVEKGQPWRRLEWIDSSRSCYSVAGAVKTVIHGINDCLSKLPVGLLKLPAAAFQMQTFVDFGHPSAAIQDSVLRIEDFAALCDRCLPDQILVTVNYAASFDGRILSAMARARNLRLIIVSTETREPGSSARQAEEMPRSARKQPSVGLFAASRAALSFLKHAGRAWLTRSTVNSPGIAAIEEDLIAFQLFSSEEKHVNSVVPLMRKFRERGWRVLAILPQEPKGRNSLAEEGIETAAQNATIDARDRRRITAYQALLPLLVPKVRRAVERQGLEHRGVDLVELLWPIIDRHLRREVPLRLQYAADCKTFFARHRPAAIRYWGGFGYWYGGSGAAGAFTDSTRPLIFDYFIGNAPDEAYYDFATDPTDLWFVCGAVQRDFFEKNGVDPDRICEIGRMRWARLDRIAADFTSAESRDRLKIPEGHRLYLLYSLNPLWNGWLGRKELVEVLDSMARAVANAPDVCLVLKPHPSFRDQVWLQEWQKQTGSQRIVVLSSEAAPEHAINAADLVVCKVSTLGLEAMILERPVISHVFDGETRWKNAYRDSVEYVDNAQQMQDLLERICGDRTAWNIWKDHRLSRQQDFLAQWFNDDDAPERTWDRMADAVIQRLTGRQNRSAPDAERALQAVAT